MKGIIVLVSILFSSAVLSNSTTNSNQQSKIKLNNSFEIVNFIDHSIDNMIAQEGLSYDRIHFKNRCYQTIWTALHYLDLNGNWISEGWWKLAPGQQGYVANTKNSIYYIHARTQQGKEWSGDEYFYVNGEGPFGFIRNEITTKSWGNWTQSFTCN